MAVSLLVVRQVGIPRPENWHTTVALAVMAAAEIVDWPVAVAFAAGHAPDRVPHDRVAQELGEAIDDSHAALEVGEVLHESGAEEEVGEALAEAPV